ncbi:hypothetical protein [Janibacter limosus]|uniref:Uncharacterized protein n=1 Tax=Janibacter limosus TaxID=53458 RepID=A0AC61U5M5_9MICO|nr:hypothetical protein [Janibacter limosus]
MRFAHTAGRAVLRLLPVIVIVSFATSLLLDLVPGDPAVALLGETATPEQVAALHRELRLDDPLAVRYVALGLACRPRRSRQLAANRRVGDLRRAGPTSRHRRADPPGHHAGRPDRDPRRHPGCLPT